MISLLTKVDQELYNQICEKKKQFGIESNYELLNTILKSVLRQMAKIEFQKKSEEVSLENEIQSYFISNEEIELPCYGERTRRGHVSWDKFSEQEDIQENVEEIF